MRVLLRSGVRAGHIVTNAVGTEPVGVRNLFWCLACQV